MNPLLLTILLSMSPISELRGGIPYALASGFGIWKAFIICVLANILVVIFVFLFLTYLHKSFLNFNWYKKSFGFLVKRVQKKSVGIEKSSGKWGYFALCIFVAIPLPMTGAWTGTLIAWFLGWNKVKSFLSIALGVLIAGIVVSLVSLGVIGIFNL